ncbi:MAG TPA: amino acid adenylation domain-containing protein [Longimicrobium sp.]|nr:amino acid adenylation domain-containing protein [Longimicrobium sp.]
MTAHPSAEVHPSAELHPSANGHHSTNGHPFTDGHGAADGNARVAFASPGAAGARATGNAPGVQEIMAQQIALMHAQLNFLRGVPMSAPAEPVPAPAPAEASPRAEAAAASAPPSRLAANAVRLAAAPVDAAADGAAAPEKPGENAAHGPHRPVRQTMSERAGFTERQARHFAELVERYNARTRRSKEYAAAHRPVLSDNRASLNFRLATKELMYPIVGDRSQGSRLWDVDGNEYIDFTIGFGVHFFGHRPGFVVKAVEEQLARGYHTGPQSDLAGPVAALFRELTGVERVTFCNTGSEAVMTALRIARTVTGRERIVLFEGSYHGCFDGILARKGLGAPGAKARPASPGTMRGMVEDVVVLPYGAPEALEYIRAHAHELAAVLVEPLRTADPENQPREFLREVREITRRSDTALIFDEMITGLRLQLRGAQGWYGVEADLATYGKVIGGGFPLGVVAGQARFMDAIDGGAWQYGDDSYPAADQTFFAGTFCKHPVTMAAAGAVLTHLRERGPALYDELNARAGRLVAALRAVLADEAVPLRILHAASFFRFVQGTDDQYLDLLFYHMLERGIYVWEGRACFVSTAHTDEDCERMVQALRESIHALREGGFLPEKPAPAAGAPSRTSAVPLSAELKFVAAPDAPPDAQPRSFPLTPGQRQVWVHAQLGDDASRAYNQQFVRGVRGRFDAAALGAALEDLVAHHEALRTVFDPSGETQHVLPRLPAPVPLVVNEGVEDPEALARAMDEAVRGVFDLQAGPLFRVHLHTRGAESQVLQLVIHHIVADGIAVDLLARDLETAYRARRDGVAPQLPAAMQLGEYVRLLAEHVAEQAEYEAGWLARFRGASSLLLPADRPRPRFPMHRAGMATLTVPLALATRLRERSRGQGCTLFTTLVAGLLATLHRVTGEDDLLVGISSAGRPFPGADTLVGHCVDALPVRSRAEGTRGLLHFLRDVRGWLLDAYEHEAFSQARLQEKLQIPRGPGAPPLISVVFNLEPGGKASEGTGVPRFAGLPLEPAGVPTLFTKIDLEVDTVDTGRELHLTALYSADLFDAGTIKRLLGHLSRVLERLAAGSDEPLAALALVDGGEHPGPAEAWSGGEDGDADGALAHELFAARAAETPDAEALRSGGRATSYGALDEAANRLAHHLAARGIGLESRVGVFATRVPETVVAILAILKAGGAFVPLDPAYPAERLRHMLADAGLRTVIAPAGLPEGVDAALVADLLDPRAEADEIAARPAGAPRVAVPPDALAYVIYTSGSTGTPRGVMVPHRGIPNLVRAQTERFGIGAESRVLQFASFSFDAAVSELFTALLSGATLVLAARDELLPGPGLVETLRRERVTVATLPPSVLAALPADGLPELATVVSAGEAVDARVVERWAAGRAFVNAYGPTEITVCATSARCAPDGRTPPIGTPLENVRVHLLDAAGVPAPAGIVGELFVGGVGVARGYLGRPARTAEAFVPDPFGPAGARLYRTGDLARRRGDGALEFAGRADRQVKIRGVRVEPGEVEAALRRHPEVADCAVAAREDVPGEKRLAAYVVAPAGAPGAPADLLREHLRACIPDAMIPSVFVALDRLPLTPNGKVDHAALPAPAREADAERYVAPRTEVERTLAAIWEEVLGVERVGVEESFFTLGGDSILVIQVVTRARRAGVDLAPAQMFDHETIAELAAVAGGAAGARAAASAEAAPAEGAARLTPIQAWFLAGEVPVPAHYNQSVLLEVDEAIPDAALEAALGAVLAHHDALRLRFRRAEAGWEAWHAEAHEIALERVYLSGLPAAEQDRMQAEAADARQASLNLERGPLGRAVLLDRGERGRVLLLAIHHLAVDTVSWSILRDDLERVCAQAGRGAPLDPGPKGTSVQRWAQVLEAYAAGPALGDELAWWLAQGGEGVGRLPVDSTADGAAAEPRTVMVELDAAETRALLQEVPAAYRTQVNDVLLCALAEAWGEVTGSPRVRLALEGHGREEGVGEAVGEGVDLTRTVGWFTSLYPVVLDVSGADGPGEKLKRVKEHLRAVPRRGIGYGALRWLAPDLDARRALAAHPEPEVSFNYLGQAGGAAPAGGRIRFANGPRGREWAPENRAPARVAANGEVRDGVLRVWWSFGAGVGEAAEALAGGWLRALRGLIAHCREAGAGGCTPSDFPLAGLTQAQLDAAVGTGRGIEDLYPLAPMQEGMLFHAVYGGEYQEYQTQAARRLEGPLDAALFRRAWAEAARRHAALRTSFVWEGVPRPLQRVHAAVELPWVEEDWSELPREEQDAALERFLAEDRARGFALGEAPLSRFALFRTAGDAHWFVWSQHHLAMDGWSVARLVAEVFRLYHGWRTGAPVQLARVRPYRDFVAWLERQDQGAAEAYWRRVLAGFAAPTPLAADRPAVAGAVIAHARRPAVFPAESARRLEEAARRAGVTLNTLLLGAWGLLLSRRAGEDDVVLGTTVSGRQAEVEGVGEMVGLFINTLPVRMRFGAGARLSAWLSALQRAQAESRRYEYTPLVRVQGWSEVPRGTPLFESHFIFENYPVESSGSHPAQPGGASAAPMLRATEERGMEWNNFPLSLLAAPGHEIYFLLSYDANRFDAESIDRILRQYVRVLEQMADGADRPLSALTLLDEAERRQVVEEWNRTEAPYPSESCVHHLFEAQVEATPDAAAVVFGNDSLTYREVDAHAGLIARRLAALGVGPEVRVGLCMERGLALIPAILGVMKAGGAYVPVDPSHPAERIGYVLEDAAVSVVLTQEKLWATLAAPAGATVVCIDEMGDGGAAEALETGVTSENLAYVIYTSGSTGRPKGVAMHHRGVVNYIHWGIAAYGADQGNGAPVFSSMAVDLTITNLLPLFAGLPVHLLPEENAVEALAEVLRTKPDFGLIKITPTHLSLLTPLLTAEEAGSAARTLVVGADFLPAEPTVFWQDHAPGVRLMNEYGPTETVVGCSAYTLPPGVHRNGPVPVGGAIQNLTFYVLDAVMQPVPVGLPGELYIGGAGVARGYLGRPGLSAEKFVPDLFAAAPGARMYRTGDRARWLEGGNLLILGRTDNQVKIRGYRVELGEIEAALRRHWAVTGCVVVLREDEPGEKRLVAYVVGGAEPEELREHLRRSLPEHMVPGAFVRLDTLPETATGKFDPRTLPAPDYAPAEERYAAPRNAVEETLAQIWAEVLGHEQVGVDDSFFELGGDSILSMQVVSRARRAGVELTARHIFEHQTIARLAEAAGLARPETARGAEEPVAGAVRLTPIQAWFFSQGHGSPWHENQSALLAVGDGVDNATLEAALAAVLAHHDAFRLRFRKTDAGWEQHYGDHAGIALERVDLSSFGDDEQERAQGEAAARLQASLGLEDGPLGRVALFDRGRRGRVLFLTFHHLAFDAVSWRIVRDDLERACAQVERGESVDLGEKSTSFAAWARALEAYAAGDATEELPHWLAQGPEGVAPLPVDGAAGRGTLADARGVSVALGAEETRALLHEVPAAYRTQVNDVLLYALAEAVSEWTGSPRVRLWLEGHGREEEIGGGIDLTRTVGWFTTIHPLVLDVAGADGPGERLKRVKEQLRAVPRRGIGHGALRWLSPDAEVRGALAEQAEPEILFNYLGQFGEGAAVESRFRPADGPRGPESASDKRRPFVVEINGGITGGSLRLAWTYGEGTHRRETIERVAGRYLDALRGLIAHCREAGAGGYTPSDFPLAEVTQQELDAVTAGRRDIEDLYPLSSMQEGMLFHALSGTGTQAYQVQVAQRLEGAFDPVLFRRAWDEVVKRHTALRTSFAWAGLRRPLQRVHAAVEVPWVVEDWSALPEEEREAALDRYLTEDRARGFDLGEAPLLRLALFRVGEGAHWFVRSQHHLLTDGWTSNRLGDEVFRLHDAWRAGRTVELGRARPYRDLVAWLARQDPGAAEGYWRGVLEGFSAPTPLAIGRPAGPDAGARYVRSESFLSSGLTRRLEEAARGAGVTMNTLLQGAWGLLLSRYGGVDDVVFGTTVSVRPPALDGVEERVGLFLNTIPARVRLPAGARVSAWLGELQHSQAGAREYDYAPLAEVQGWSAVPRGTPLFESLFIFENYPAPARGGTGPSAAAAVRVAAARVVEWTTYPLTFMAAPGQELLLCLCYDESRFDAEEITRMLRHLERVLEQLAGDGETRLAEVELMDAEERARVLAAWNDTDRPYADTPVHALVAEHARQTPDAAAVLHADGALTFGEVERRAAALARRLRALGVKPETRVGLCMERTPDLVVGALGIWKAGGAYVPLDPSYPPERLGWIVSDAALPVIVTAGIAAEALPESEATLVRLDELPGDVSGEVADEVAVDSSTLAYVIYTSGSTGRPKGVLVQHGSLANILAVTREWYSVRPGDVVPAMSSFAFDVWLFEAFLPLTAGAATRLVARDRVMDVPALLDEIADTTFLHAVPALMREIAREERERPRLTRLRDAMVGGDRVQPDLVAEMRAAFPRAVTHVFYGPTEAAIMTSGHHAPEDGVIVGHPIGRPLGNTRLYVMDEVGNPQPAGLPGEVLIGGAGVARGYLGRASLTAEQFVPDPFSGQPGARLYRTGDRGRWRQDGMLEFLGRTDAQVKVRGFRIEPGEVEAVLRGHDGVEEVVVVAREDVPGEAQLVAYVVPAGEAADASAGEGAPGPLVAALKEHALRHLPAHMVPGAFVTLERFPLTTHGKVDLRALPAPGRAEGGGYVAPRTEVEEALAAIWASVLGVERVGVEDDFFALGGHSLRVMRLLAGVKDAFGVEISIRAVFATPTLEALAAEIERKVYEDVAAMEETEAEALVGSDAEGG